MASVCKWPARLARICCVAAMSMLTIGSTATAAANESSGRMPRGIDTVFLLLFENHDWSAIEGSDSAPYLNGLLKRPDAAYAGEYHNVPPPATLHPSEPNYLWLEAGTNVFPDATFAADSAPSASNSTNSPDHLTALLQAKGIAWTSYQESVSGDDCPIANAGDYTPRHNPVVFFQDVVGDPPSPANVACRQHVRPYDELADDLTGDRVRGYAIVTPNLCHDMHSNDCPGSEDVVRQGDDWLRANLPTLLASPIYRSGAALIAITWDEGGHGNKPIGMILLSPKTKGDGYTNQIAYSHASWVKTVEDIFGLSPLLGHAADPDTRDLADFFVDDGAPLTALTTAERALAAVQS
ncbi:MAG TPA: alkaline phosphatase family protein [Thermomicrobiales bacterium]|nr:alkaline phosphatase family protein [Thermomicrobiales bacterium]